MLTDEATIRATIGERVRALETDFSAIRDDVEGVRDEVRTASDRIERLSREFGREIGTVRDLIVHSKETNWSVVLQGILVITLLFGAGVTPLWITANYNKAEVEKMLPREVAAHISAEQETQFRGISKEMQTQIDHNFADNTRQDVEIKGLRDWRLKAVDQIAKVEQALHDHDQYLWPRTMSRDDEISAIERDLNKLKGVIDGEKRQ